jgi:hypothetical protein
VFTLRADPGISEDLEGEASPPEWEQRAMQVGVALCGAILESPSSGGLQLEPDEADILEAALRAVAHDAVERDDFFDHAMVIAEDLIARSKPEIDELLAHGGRVAFRTLETLPAELTGQALQPLTARSAEDRLQRQDSLTWYRWRSLHQAAHAYVGVVLLEEPVEAAFGRFKLRPRGNAYSFDNHLRTLLAGDVLDSMVGRDAVPAPSVAHCPCGEMAMALIASAADVAAEAGDTIGSATARAGKAAEVHDIFIDGFNSTVALVEFGLRTGAIERAATAIRRYGAITFCPPEHD